MIRWCSYCQSFMGQSQPLNSFSFSHGICEDCNKSVRMGRKWTREIEAIKEFYESILGNIQNGIYVEPAKVLSEGRRLKLPVSDMLLGVLNPLLVQVGQYFEDGQISIEKEHLFSKAINEVIVLLRDESGGNLRDGIVLFCAKENIHSIGLHFLQMLIVREVSVDVAILDRGPETFDEFLSLIEKSRPKAIGVSFALPTQIDYLRELIHWGDRYRDEYKGDSRVPVILAGGPACSGIASFPGVSGKVFIADAYDTKSTLGYIAGILGTESLIENKRVSLEPASDDMDVMRIPAKPVRDSD